MSIPARYVKTGLFGLLLVAGFSLSCASREKAAPATPAVDITGKWKAVFETPEGNLEVFLDISKDAEGTHSATITVPIMDAYDVPVIFRYEEGAVYYEIMQVGVIFEGQLIDPATISGKSSGGGTEEGEAVYKRVE